MLTALALGPQDSSVPLSTLFTFVLRRFGFLLMSLGGLSVTRCVGLVRRAAACPCGFSPTEPAWAVGLGFSSRAGG